MEIDAWQLKIIIRETAKEAVEEYIRRNDPTSDEITYSKACRKYGEGWLDHQIAIGAANGYVREFIRTLLKYFPLSSWMT